MSAQSPNLPASSPSRLSTFILNFCTIAGLLALLFQWQPCTGQIFPPPIIVDDIFPGPLSSYADKFEALPDGTIIFFAIDSIHGREPWIRTPDGQVLLLLDINPGLADGIPSEFSFVHPVVLGDKLIFIADDGSHGAEPWVTDGTSAGTMMLADIFPGMETSYTMELVKVGDKVYFPADDGVHGMELWRTDGTPAGTELVVDIFPGNQSSWPSELTVFDNYLCFGGDNGSSGWELMLFNPLTGQIEVIEINPGPSGSYVGDLAIANDKLWFSAWSPGYGFEPWSTDGTQGGTSMEGDLCPGDCSSYPHSFTGIAGSVAFVAEDGTHGEELWLKDHPMGPPTLVDIFPGPNSSIPFGLTAVDGWILFGADNDIYGRELWKTDGTPVGTEMVKDIQPGPGSSWPAELTMQGGKAFFRADDGSTGYELWCTDGSLEGTFLVYDLNMGSNSSVPGNFAPLGGSLFFSADDGVTGTEPWELIVCPEYGPEVCDGEDNDCDGLVDWDDPDLIDEVPPVAMCGSEPVTIPLDIVGTALIDPSLLDAGSYDSCALLGLTTWPEQVDCSMKGDLIPVALIAIDWAGNTDTCTAQVVVVDDLPPAALCQEQVVTLFLDQSGQAQIPPAAIDAGSLDNCGIANRTVYPNTLDCSVKGDAVPVSLVVTDISGNTDTCVAHVTAIDTLAPSAVCKNTTVYLDSLGKATLNPADVDGGSTDNCGIDSLAVSPAQFDCAVKGDIIPVQLTAVDLSGNQSNCMAQISVEDNIPPTALCKDLILYADSSGTATITPADLDGGSYDNCGIYSLMIGSGPFPSITLPCGFEDFVMLTAIDFSLNSSFCSGYVTVKDTLPPKAQCKDITVQLDPMSLEKSIDPQDVDAGSSDNCGIVDKMVMPSEFSCDHLGPQVVTLTVSDAAGNESSCMATVTVEDSGMLEANCIPALQVALDANGMAMITFDDIDFGSKLNCSTTTDVAPEKFDCNDLGANVVILTLQDADGNQDICATDVNVIDNIPPTALCQPNVTLTLNANGLAVLTPAQVDLGSFDNCGIASTEVMPNAFNCATTGIFQVTLTVTDLSGNKDMCTSQVTVVDPVLPTAICVPSLVVPLNAMGTAIVTPAMIDAGSNDNCGIDNRIVAPNQFTCNDLGLEPVTLTVFDPSGNQASCVTQVTVVDNMAPLAICKPQLTIPLDADGMASLTPDLIDNGSSDNCNITSSVVDPSQFGCQDLGMHGVTLTLWDPSGNQDTCMSQIEIIDNMPPAFKCDTIRVELDNQQDTITLTVPQLSSDTITPAMDNCGIDTIMASQPTFTWSDTLVPVQIVVIDSSGNADTCVSYVRTVLPTTTTSPTLVEVFRLSPNPTQDHLTLEWTLSQKRNLHLRLYDLAGRIALQDQFEADPVGHHTLNLSNLPKGVYVLWLTNGSQSWSWKIVRLP